jgi:nitrate reductase gamma subunit
MRMEILAYLVAYAGVIVFLAAVIRRVLMWVRMPIHLRWELYPVAHEAKKASYGGSYLEESEWWSKPREVSVMGELKVMVPEILFLVALKEHNRKLWLRSFPFHFGLYLISGATVLMILDAISARVLGVPYADSALRGVFQYGIIASGGLGLLFALLGAATLIRRRLQLPELRDFSAPADYFNLAFFVVVFGSSLSAFAATGISFFKGVSAFVSNLMFLNFVPLDESIPAGAIFGSVILMSILLAYIPMTHMSHFIGKYFAYHAIRWNDEPNLPGGTEEKTIQEALSQPISWAAPHIGGDGKKSWADVATAEQEDEEKK